MQIADHEHLHVFQFNASLCICILLYKILHAGTLIESFLVYNVGLAGLGPSKELSL